jgi:hypothetical protein
MADYQEKYDWYLSEVQNHSEMTAEGRFNAILAVFDTVDPPPGALMTDEAYADYWANNYDDQNNPWPPQPQ